MKNKIAVIFGGSFGLYSGVFKEIDKNFDCKIMRVSPFRLKVRIKNVEVSFYLCNNPVRDKIYYLQKRWLQSSQWKELMPPPTNEVVKIVGKSLVVLFFGYCGTFKGKKSIYTPEVFKEIFFKEGDIMKVDELNIKIKNKIKIKNFLKPAIKGENATVITSNLTLAPHHEKSESKDKVIRIAQRLSKFGDVVDKETYQIAKYFNHKIPLGVYLQSSDVLTSKRHMISHKGMEINKNKFNKNVIKSIKFALTKI